MKNLKVLFCASEVSPYAKTGGLADVAGALPEALQSLGIDVRIFMPLYRTARNNVGPLKLVAENLIVPAGIHEYKVHLWQTATPSGIPVYLLEKEEFFDRSHLYGTPVRGDYEDNAERFITFCRSIHSLCIQLEWYPSIFHLHDWQTGLAAAYHRLIWRYDPNFKPSATVFTIHNLAYQGIFPATHFSLTHLPPQAMSPLRGMEFFGKCNFMKAGLLYSTMLTTVSPTYSQEIQSEEFGFGLEGVLEERRKSLRGILNGIDTNIWNPELDPYLEAHFSADDLSGKEICKRKLLEDIGLGAGSADRPLLAMISRLATQKGFDLLEETLEDLMDLPIHMVILGTGDARIENQLKVMASKHPDQLVILSRFDEALAHRIEAGADIFLMPSRYEPCGLNQMYSLRYGAVPVVHATGGLEDSVVDERRNPGEGNGFKFVQYEAPLFLAAVQSAIDLFMNDADRWKELQRRGMTKDFSWTHSAEEYLNVYQEALRRA